MSPTEQENTKHTIILFSCQLPFILDIFSSLFPLKYFCTGSCVNEAKYDFRKCLDGIPVFLFWKKMKFLKNNVLIYFKYIIMITDKHFLITYFLMCFGYIQCIKCHDICTSISFFHFEIQTCVCDTCKFFNFIIQKENESCHRDSSLNFFLCLILKQELCWVYPWEQSLDNNFHAKSLQRLV